MVNRAQLHSMTALPLTPVQHPAAMAAQTLVLTVPTWLTNWTLESILTVITETIHRRELEATEPKSTTVSPAQIQLKLAATSTQATLASTVLLPDIAHLVLLAKPVPWVDHPTQQALAAVTELLAPTTPTC